MGGMVATHFFKELIMTQLLSFTNHSRSFHGFTYVYPVISRRSNGLSLGINLNINNACNWRCIYCQVDGLIRGKPVPIDLIRLEYELDYMLDWIIMGNFLIEHAPEKLRRFNDIALSGNGESTLAPEFFSVVEIIAKLRNKYKLGDVKTVLITNGSEIDKENIINSLAILSKNNGEVWFKIDSATTDGINKINQVNLNVAVIVKKLELSASICRTYIQTCLFQNNETEPSINEIKAYLLLLSDVSNSISGVLLYSTARNPSLSEGANISSVSEAFLLNVATQIKILGLPVKYYV